MLGRLAQLLLAFIVALAATMPTGARAMPMPPGISGTSIQQHCPSCPHPARTSTSSDKMPACQILACAGAIATLPSPALLPGRVLRHSAYLAATPVRWTAAVRAPDPFPPRPIALV